VVLYYEFTLRSCLAKGVSKVNHRGREGDCIDSEHAQQTELDWQHLIRSCDFDRNSHCKLLVGVTSWLFVLFDQVSGTCIQNRTIRLYLSPNFELAVSLNEAQCWIELQVCLKILRESQLNFHGVRGAVEQDDFFAVELLINQNIKVVLLLFYINRHIDTAAFNCDLNWPRIILVFKE